MVLDPPPFGKVMRSVPREKSLFLLFPTEVVEVVINVYDNSDYGLKLSDKADIESTEFPVYSVQKPRLVVVPGKMAVQSNFRYI